ncbi:hypothetical protein ABIB56_001046 [Glaciihabitans sp. UYNi722]
MNRYAQFAEHKRGIINTLRAGWATGRMATPTTRERITAVIASYLEEGARSGTLRTNIPADDVTTMLLGIFLSTGSTGAEAQIHRLLDLLVDSLRPRPTG